MHRTQLRRARRGTRCAFLLAGIAVAGWAALVPYTRARLGLDDGTLGLLLLCPGLGSLAAMGLSGRAASRFGCRWPIVGFGLALCLSLPVLAVAPGAWGLGAALLLFGAALGGLDVAMNVQAVAIEAASARPMMSGFHGLYSAGGIAGGLCMILFRLAGLAEAGAALALGLMLSGLLAVAAGAPGLPVPRPAPGPAARPGRRRSRDLGVAALGLFCAIGFLAEGGMVDWSGLLLDARSAGGGAPVLGYALFSAAMTAGRFGGDRLSARLGRRLVLAGGALLAACGFVVAALVPGGKLPILAGFVAAGRGLANLAPLLIGAAGTRPGDAAGAVALASMIGYGGVLLGPGLLGMLARATGLAAAFLLVALLLAAVPLGALLLQRSTPLAAGRHAGMSC